MWFHISLGSKFKYLLCLQTFMNCVFLRWNARKFSLFIQLKHVNKRNNMKVTIYIYIYIYICNVQITWFNKVYILYKFWLLFLYKSAECCFNILTFIILRDHLLLCKMYWPSMPYASLCLLFCSSLESMLS
jgi:hypothetical protein